MPTIRVLDLEVFAKDNATPAVQGVVDKLGAMQTTARRGGQVLREMNTQLGAMEGVAGTAAGAVGKLTTSLATGFATGGPIGAAIAGTTAGLKLLFDSADKSLDATLDKLARANADLEKNRERMIDARAKTLKDAEAAAKREAELQATLATTAREGASARAQAEAAASGSVFAVIEAEKQKRLSDIKVAEQAYLAAGASRLAAEKAVMDQLVAAELDAATKRRAAITSLAREVSGQLKGLGDPRLEDLTKRLDTDVLADAADKGIGRLNDLLQAGKVSAREYAMAVEGLVDQVKRAGATTEQLAAAQANVNREVARAAPGYDAMLTQFKELNPEWATAHDQLTGHSLDTDFTIVGQAAAAAGDRIEESFGKRFDSVFDRVGRASQELRDVNNRTFDTILGRGEVSSPLLDRLMLENTLARSAGLGVRETQGSMDLLMASVGRYTSQGATPAAPGGGGGGGEGGSALLATEANIRRFKGMSPGGMSGGMAMAMAGGGGGVYGGGGRTADIASLFAEVAKIPLVLKPNENSLDMRIAAVEKLANLVPKGPMGGGGSGGGGSAGASFASFAGPGGIPRLRTGTGLLFGSGFGPGFAPMTEAGAPIGLSDARNAGDVHIHLEGTTVVDSERRVQQLGARVGAVAADRARRMADR
jgi:hypothetical protein